MSNFRLVRKVVVVITGFGDYRLQCHACGVMRIDVGFDLDMTYLWANQHATKMRLFCHRCGVVHDVTIRRDQPVDIVRHSMRCSIRREIE